jgi:hypothetical protein
VLVVPPALGAPPVLVRPPAFGGDGAPYTASALHPAAPTLAAAKAISAARLSRTFGKTGSGSPAILDAT